MSATPTRPPAKPPAPRSGQGAKEVLSNPIIVGSIILLTALIGVVVSYSANRGLPFVPTYEVKVDVPDAAELIEGGSEVRVGGARAGLVKEVEALKTADGQGSFARLTLGLEKKLEGIPTDSEVQVRPRSILGAKYLDLTLGSSEEELPAGGQLPQSQAKPVVELDEAFNVFDEETTKGLQDTVIGLGDGLAGRGSSLNASIVSANDIIAPAGRLLRLLADRGTDLEGFIQGAAAAGRALSPVAPTLGPLLANGARTLRAVETAGDALEETLDQLPPTEAVGTRALTRITPVLADAASIARALRPTGDVLRDRAGRIGRAVRSATPILRRTPELSQPLTTTLKALDTLSRDPDSPASVRRLISTLETLAPVLLDFNPAQTECNTAGLWARNVASVFSDGDTLGPWLNTMVVLEPRQMLQSANPAPNLHANPLPVQSNQQCEAGNEPYLEGRRLGNPEGVQDGVEITAPPAGVGAP